MDKDILIGERGNVLAVNDDGGVMFRGRLPDGRWLVFDYIPGNYEAVTAGVVTKTEDEVREGVERHYEGWTFMKKNL